MNWYPWLNNAYMKIIALHQKKQGHHALLLHANAGMGSDSLIYAISRWLMCQQPVVMKSCGDCHSCQLMLAGTHPDWHKIDTEKGKNTIGIEIIRCLTEVLVSHAQQGGAKVVWFPRVEALTEAASNALLKTLEEPTDNTYFFLESRYPDILLATLRSRCFYYYLSVPERKTTISWLQKQKITLSLVEIETGIKLNAGAPLAALTLLQPENWLKRKKFCQSLMQHLSTKRLLSWLPELDQEDAAGRISWLISLLLDTVKYQLQSSNYCVNRDQLLLITKLAAISSVSVLLKSATEWQNCRHQLMSVMGLNQELRLISQLINWQNSLYYHN
ncbi:DNA polymerase III subunit delta' [Arsenophonus endosymbiont of Aleurodicus dispersus]|uniref:DNA polymerase III subunit delta' C-terminal domain-containing protein n=1 Tax=Arsenophonus endosymbiont of Aleurodicus dispersus TaxID=235559 RepID=UPI000EAD696A|nr:DNA polymerase III subunit delta' C-terminal domain-containing protein [Arsenophonus endosymbiont of Aleurodicus dispersus]VAY02453.1 DNA polymerase III subunit delta' [Arsenophonus endosymbiont of Aleurodicus dispersus]